MKLFHSAVNMIGLPAIFWIHSGICIVACFVATLIIPDTQGKTLTELSEMYLIKPKSQDTNQIPSKLVIHELKKSGEMN